MNPRCHGARSIEGHPFNTKFHLGRDAMGGQPDKPTDVSQRAAMVLLALFLVAVIAAMAVTVSSVTAPVGVLAASVVSPIVGLAILFLYFERRGRLWSFAGAAALGILGVTLRLIINSQPRLEVGGGLPLWVTGIYAALGTLVVGTSLWACLSLRRATRSGVGGRPPWTAMRPPG
jgi:hypothetical protein